MTDTRDTDASLRMYVVLADPDMLARRTEMLDDLSQAYARDYPPEPAPADIEF